MDPHDSLLSDLDALSADYLRVFDAHVASAPHGEEAPRSVNVLGLNAFDYPDAQTRGDMLDAMERIGLSVLSVWADGSVPDGVERAGTASANIVCSSAGVDVAAHFERELGIPYITAEMTSVLDRYAHGLVFDTPPNVLVIGEPLSSNLLRRLLKQMGAGRVDVVSRSRVVADVARAGDFGMLTEDDLRDAMGDNGYDFAVGDASYRPYGDLPLFELSHPPVHEEDAPLAVLSRAWCEELADWWNE